MKAALIRLGIRGFNPKLKKAAERLDGLRTPEGDPIRELGLDHFEGAILARSLSPRADDHDRLRLLPIEHHQWRAITS
jgi:hypothetical protein